MKRLKIKLVLRCCFNFPPKFPLYLYSMKFLIVEDEKDLSESICHLLTEKGYVCETAMDFPKAREKLALYVYDVVLLDITLPGGNGLQLLRELKEDEPATGVLILSAKNALDDKISGLELGADDYLPKPFHMGELLARVNAIIRRRQFGGHKTLTFNEITLYTEEQRATVNGESLELTQKEYALLLYLIVNRNRVLTKEAIAMQLWGDHLEMANNYDFIYTHVKNLRRKMAEKKGRDYLQTLYGLGYKFSDQ